MDAVTETLSRQGDELSLLDFLVAIAESWRLLIFGPLIVGLSVFALLQFVSTNRYASEAILNISQNEAALLQSARVIDPVIQETDWVVRHGNLTAARQALLEDGLNIEKLSDVSYFRVTTVDHSPESAHALLTGLIDQLIRSSAPRGVDRQVLERRLEGLENSRASLNLGLERLDTLSERAAEGQWGALMFGGDSAQSRVTLVSRIAEIEQEILGTRISLEGSVSQSDVIQEPTVASNPLSGGTVLVVILATLGAGFALLLFALIRFGLDNAARDSRSAEKIGRIKRAFMIGRPRAG